MIWWAETDSAVKPRSIEIVLVLLHLLITHIDGLLVVKPFLQKMLVSPLNILYVIAIFVCTWMTPKYFLLMIIILYVHTVCLAVHQMFFS